MLPLLFWLGCEDEQEDASEPEPDNEPPTSVILSPVSHYNGSFHLNWTKNEDEDFSHYDVIRTANQEIVHTTNDADSTQIALINIQPDITVNFQIKVFDSAGNSTNSNIEMGSSYGLIAATSYGGGYLYTVNTNGNNLKQHSLMYYDNQIIINGEPEFSSDGSKIFFGGHIGGNYDIWSVGINGEDVIRLTTSSNDDRFPKISPNGEKIVYVSNDGGASDIFIMNADGSNKQNITYSSSINNRMSFSPDGAKIVFVSDRTGNKELFSVGIDGANLVQLTNISGQDEDDFPSFSPDGEKILFQRKYGCGYHIMIMNSNGSNLNTLTDCPFTEPIVSPIGSEIVFYQSNGQIMRMNLNSGIMTAIITPHNNTNYRVYNPSFNSTGTRLVYIDRVDNTVNIHTINIDGTGDQPITNLNNTNTSWRFLYPNFQPQ